MTDLFANLPQLLFSAFAFIITISFLVAIHEYGHFWVARRFGVRIEKFSIGFGKPIVKWHGKRDNTEYSLSWIPLGGYVKMYGESPLDAEKNDAANDERVVDLSGDLELNNDDMATGSFSALPPFKRLLIAVAGPAVNLIFAVFALWLLFIIGVPAFKPTIGSVNNAAMTAANMHNGDTIVSVNGSAVDTLSDATIYLVDALGNASVPLTTVDANGREKTATLDLSAYEAGNEMAVQRFVGFNWALVSAYQDQPLTVRQVLADGAAKQAGLQENDLITHINGAIPTTVSQFVQRIQASPAKPIALTVARQGQTLPITLTPNPRADNLLQGFAGLSISQVPDEQLLKQYETVKRYGWLTALSKSIAANYKQGELMLKTLWRLAMGKASVDNLGGPLTIADYSGKTLEAGYVTYFQFLAAISLILAVMNLLPVPVLDGGHIVMCLVEMVRGKPLSERALDILMRLGGSVLLTFMLFVISLDVWRYVFQ